MVLAWENPQEVFLMLVVVVVLTHWRFLHFWAPFPCHHQSTLSSQAREGLHQLRALHYWLFYFCQDFSSQFSPERYGFELTFSIHRWFLPCTPSPHFAIFLWLICRQGHPIQDLLLRLPSLSFPFRLTHGLELLML